MKQSFLDHSIKWITAYNKSYSDEDIEKLKYGLEGLYLTITKLIIISFLSIILGMFKEMIIIMILFNIIRYPAFGFHADNSMTCLLFSTALLIGLPYIILHVNLTTYVKTILCIICFINFLVFAPADTPKRPLTNIKKRHIRKVASMIIATIYIVAIFLIKDVVISKLILTGLIIETIMINPVTYKIFHQQFNNYKLYTSQ